MSLDVWLYRPGDRDNPVFEQNITHNLGAMAEAAGIYEAVWHPERLGITTAAELVDPLRHGIALMKLSPEQYRAHNAKNGWGMYENFVPWLERYLTACIEYPDALVGVSR